MEKLHGKKSLLVARLACLAVAATALIVVFRRVDMHEFTRVLSEARWDWFLAATILYGTMFLPGAWRWHLMLRLTGCAVHPSVTVRLAVIGHLFYTVMFGAVGGDAAKSVLYARWYRLPLPEVLAAAPLDRLLGFCGLILFGVFAFGLSAFHGAFASSERLGLRWPGWWALAVLMLIAMILFVQKWLGRESAGRKFLSAFTGSGRRLLASPRTILPGLACGLLVQVAISGTLALNLHAVSHSPVPWSRLFWTFPIISLVSALPITVSGLGVREGAALVFFAPYGIAPADAVAASLLTLASSMIWVLIAMAVLGRENKWQFDARPVPKTISVIIPTRNEENSLTETVRRARAVPEVCEIIIVDGGSSDRTRELAAQLGCRVLTATGGRGGQMRCGAAAATGDVILLLHADTWLPPQAGKAVMNCLRDTRVVGGGFWKIFRDGSPLLFGSRFKCAIRLYLGRRIAGDQGLFARREVLSALGGVPDLPLMEEFELCRQLRRAGRLALADATVITSARRFVERGVVRTYLRMWWVTTKYRLGTPPHELVRLYDRK